MSTEINLLPHENEEVTKQRKSAKILNFIAVGLLVVVCLISLGIFISIQALNPESIRKQQEDVLKKLAQYQDRQVKLLIVNNRIENINNILKTRRNFSKMTSSLLAAVPGGLTIDSFEIDSKMVAISGQSQSLSIIGDFLNNLTEMVRNKVIIKSLTLASLNLDDDKKVYVVSVSAEL
jgi:Tfp pilus assembly protein PilN